MKNLLQLLQQAFFQMLLVEKMIMPSWLTLSALLRLSVREKESRRRMEYHLLVAVSSADAENTKRFLFSEE